MDGIERYKKAFSVFGMFYGLKGESLRDTSKLWWQILKEYPIDRVEAALKYVVRTVGSTYGKELPPISDVVSAIEGRPEDRAILAYGKFKEHMLMGATRSVAYDDPVIHSTIKAMGGISECGLMKDDEWTRKQFIETYLSCANMPSEAHPKYVVGTCEIDNAHLIEEWPALREACRIHFIGDSVRAQRLLGDSGVRQLPGAAATQNKEAR